MRRLSLLIFAATFAAGACGLCGCEPVGEGIRTSASLPATRPDLKPLPAKALVKLADLAPKIAKPTNPPGSDEVPQRAKAAVKQAEENIADRDFAAAIDLLERAVGYAPNNPRIRRWLGLAYAGLPNRGKALENLRLSAKAAPDDLRVQLLLGAILAAQKHDTDAIKHLRTALKCSQAKPENPLAAEALLTLSAVLKRQGYWTAALQCQNTLGEWMTRHGQAYAKRSVLRALITRSESLLMSQGRLLVLLRRYVDAAEYFRKAFTRDRTNPRAARLLIGALLQARKYRRAEKMLIDIVTEPAQRKHAATLAERLCVVSGDKGVLVRLWRAHSAGEQLDSDFAVSLAEVAQRMGAEDQAVAIGKSVLAEQPRNAPMSRLMCGIYARRGKVDKALRMLANMLAEDPAAVRAVEEGVKQVLQSGVAKDFERDFARAAIADRSDVKHALHYVAGKLALVRGRVPLAADQFKRSVDAKLKFLPGYEALVDVYLADGDHDEVGRIVGRIEKLVGDSNFASYIRGKVHLAQGQPELAVAALIKALEFDSRDVRAMLLLAEAYERMGLGTRSRAVARLSEALRIEPDNVDIYRRLFRQLMSSPDNRSRTQARALVTSLLKRRPGSILGRLMLVELNLGSHKREEALALLGKLMKEAPQNVEVILMHLAVELSGVEGKLSKKDFRRVSDRLEAILGRQRRHVDARRMLASLLDRQGMHDKALPGWRELYRELPDRIDIAAPYVRALTRAKQFKIAAEALAEIVRRNPRHVWARQALIDALVELKRYGKAEQAAREWLAKAKNYEQKRPALMRLLKLYETIRKYDEAQEVLDEWLVDAPAAVHLALRRKKLELYGKAEQFDKAIEYAREWIRQGANPQIPRFLLARVLADGKAYAKALKLLDEWIGTRRDDSVTIYRHVKVDVLVRAGELKEATDYVSKWIAESPRALEPRQTLISALARAKKYDRAISRLEAWMRELSRTAASQPATTAATSRAASAPASKTVVVDRKTAEILRWCRQSIVRLLALQGKYVAAAARASAFLRVDAEDTEVLSILSSCLSSMGKDKQAVDVLKKALKIKPNDPQLNNNLGYLYAEMGIKLDEAERMIRKAIDARKEAAFVDSLGWVLYKKGRFAEAAAAFKQVLAMVDELEEGHPVIHDHIGDTYYRLGKVDEAVEQWRQAVKMAEKEEIKTGDTRIVLDRAPGKIKAVQAGEEPKVAPLGKGVKETRRP